MSLVPNGWVDWQEYVYQGVKYGFNINNTGDAPRGEWIPSFFYEYSPGTWKLQSTSEGVIRLKFDWIGETKPPEVIEFDFWTQADASAGGPPGTWSNVAHYLFADGAPWIVTSSSPYGISVTSSNYRVAGTVTGGATTVYYNVGILNSISADCEYPAQVGTMSSFAVQIHQP